MIYGIILLGILIFLFFRYRKNISEIIKDKKYVAKKIVEIILFGMLSVTILTFFIKPLIEPKTDIEVSCVKPSDFDVAFTIQNKADFAVEDFYILILNRKLIKNKWDLWLDPLCEESSEHKYTKKGNKTIIDYSEDWKQIRCKYIPPKSKIQIRFTDYYNSDEYNMMYWSKNTPITNKNTKCDFTFKLWLLRFLGKDREYFKN